VLTVAQNHVYDEHTNALNIYWSDKDVISWLAEHSDDEHLQRIQAQAAAHAQNMGVASRAVDEEAALFDDDDDGEDEVVLGRPDATPEAETSKQRLLSMAKAKPAFEGLRMSPAGHKIQEIKEFMTVPVRAVSCEVLSQILSVSTGHHHGRPDEEPAGD
jgi:protein SSD1